MLPGIFIQQESDIGFEEHPAISIIKAAKSKTTNFFIRILPPF